jgi:hypothetical protein
MLDGTNPEETYMVKCERCGWSFNSIRLVHGGSCPRCRLRDGVLTPLIDEPDERAEPSLIDLFTEARERARQAKERSRGTGPDRTTGPAPG